MQMPRLIVYLICFSLASTAAPGSARETLGPRGTKVIAGATLIDGTPRPPLRDAVVVIAGSHIDQVGTTDDTDIPGGAEIIDATGKFVIPGLADMHNHLARGSFGFGESTSNRRRHLANLLGWGITLAFSPGINDLEAFAELKRLSAEPAAPYPHFFGVGKQFSAAGGHVAGAYEPGTPDLARTAVRELAAARVDAVKLVYSPVTYAIKAGLPVLETAVMTAVIDEAHRQGLTAYVHAPILSYAKEALRAGADGLVHGIVSGPVDDEFIALMKKNQAVYMTTHSIFEAAGDIAGWARRGAAFDRRGLVAHTEFETGMNPAMVREWESLWDNHSYMKKRLPVLRANTKRVFDAGLLVVPGSDTGNSGAGLLNGLTAQLELRLLVESGLSPRQVLRIATINAARMVGQEHALGSVEPGKLADMVILDADPLADIENVYRIFRVVKGGVVYRRAELLRPRVVTRSRTPLSRPRTFSMESSPVWVNSHAPRQAVP